MQQFRQELDAALESYAAELGLYQTVGSRLGEANVRQAIGDVQRFRQELDAALGSYGAALELYRAIGERLGEANTLAAQSRLIIDSDEAQSQELLEQALRLREAIGAIYDMAADLGNYGTALLQRGRNAEAAAYLQRARALFAVRNLHAQVEQVDALLAQTQNEPSA